MPAVVISRSLRAALTDEPARDLAAEFRDYKAGALSFGGTFGRDKRFSWPSEAVSHELWHVHLEDEAAIPTWDRLTANFHLRNYTQDNYTSDTMLVYGRLWAAYKAPFLLHSILSPNGHAMMEDGSGMKALAYEYCAEVDAYRREMPGGGWILVE